MIGYPVLKLAVDMENLQDLYVDYVMTIGKIYQAWQISEWLQSQKALRKEMTIYMSCFIK